MAADRYERRHRRTARNINCVQVMANADFDAVPSLSEAMGLEEPATTAPATVAKARMTWKDDGCLIRSGRGRFAIGVTFRRQATYRLLTDTATGRESPCRTVASAKDLARRLA